MNRVGDREFVSGTIIYQGAQRGQSKPVKPNQEEAILCRGWKAFPVFEVVVRERRGSRGKDGLTFTVADAPRCRRMPCYRGESNRMNSVDGLSAPRLGDRPEVDSLRGFALT